MGRNISGPSTVEGRKEDYSESALSKTISAPNGGPRAREGKERCRKSEKAEQIGNLPCSLAETDRERERHTGECTRRHHAGAIPLSLSAFLAVQRKWPPSIQPLGFPAKKNMHFTFCKNPRGLCPGHELCDSNCSISRSALRHPAFLP